MSSHPTPSSDDWFADESFWKTTFPFMFPESRLAAAEQEVDRVLALAQCTGGTVLDLACGPGRHSVPLAARGFSVTGVDRSEFLLDHARARAERAGQRVEIIRSDMRDFVRPNTYDLALSLFTSFGFFRNDADNERVLHNVASSLRPGGVLVMDLLGKETLARIFTPTVSRDVPDGILMHRHRIIDDWSRISNEWLLIRGDTVETFRFSHWLYSARELRAMLARAGFGDVRVHGDLAGAPYDNQAARLVAVARKAPVGEDRAHAAPHLT